MSNNNNTSETSTELSFEMKGKTIVVLGWNVAGRDTYIWFDEQRKEKNEYFSNCKRNIS